MRRLRFVIVPLAAVLLACGWYARYRAVNRFYEDIDDSAEISYSPGEYVPFGEDCIDGRLRADGYLLRVDGFRIVDFKDVCPDMEKNAPERLALVDVTLKNSGSKAEGVILSELDLYGTDQAVYMNYEALGRLNPVLGDSADINAGISLAEGTEYSLTLPYSLYRRDFSRWTWDRLDRYGLTLQLTVYPVRKTVKIQ